jgi:hypothetical protein
MQGADATSEVHVFAIAKPRATLKAADAAVAPVSLHYHKLNASNAKSPQQGPGARPQVR